jgi:tRNA (5-methylaminomethyl-2-thiouridylate)-methyltransferase
MNVAVLLSGGVDSSVALRLLQEQTKYPITSITAFYLKIWLEDEVSYLGSCPWEDDLHYARQVCEQAGVPLEVVPLQTEYYNRVVEYALAELRLGRTPSPDIFCNQRIKFGAFYHRVGREFDLVVSGHYAHTETSTDGLTHLLRAPDPVKDQSYFLSHLSQDQVAKLYFPLGNLQKNQVRELAQAYDLPNKDRRDSQGICFLGNIKYPDFVRHYLGEQPGEIRDLTTGKVLGAHKGFWFHTIGQRSGLGLGNGPWYVVHKEPKENVVFVSHQDHLPKYVKREFEISDLTWITGTDPATNLPKGLNPSTLEELNHGLTVKLRHGPELTPAQVRWADTEGDFKREYSSTAEHETTNQILAPNQTQTTPVNPTLVVTLEEPDQGVAPGQFTVLYRGRECIGSGKIQEFWDRMG